MNEFEKQMLIYRIDNLKNLSNKDFMVSFAGIVNDFDLLQKEDIENLQDHDWCRDNIKHEYTIIKSISKNVSNTLVEEKKDNIVLLSSSVKLGFSLFIIFINVFK